MASVRKFPGSQYWTACYRQPNGERVQRSTRLTDRAEAEQLAETWEKPFRMLSQKKWIQRHTQKICHEADAIAGIESTLWVPARQWLETWVQKAAHSVKEKTAELYRTTIAQFLATLKTRAAEPLADVRPKDVSDWRDALVHEHGLTEATANGRLAILNAAMKEALRTEVIAKNPCTGLRFRGVEKKRQKRSVFTLEQFRSLLDACAADPALREWRTLLMLLGLTSARQQEAAQLGWGQVDFAQNRITLVRGKQHDQRHIVPMDAMLRAELAQAYEAKTALMVMPGLAAKDNRALSHTFRRKILPKIGIVQEYGTLEKGKRGGLTLAPLGLHSLRHSLSSWLDETGATPAQRRDVLGHESAKINERYTHANLEQIATAIGRVSAKLTEKKA